MGLLWRGPGENLFDSAMFPSKQTQTSLPLFKKGYETQPRAAAWERSKGGTRAGGTIVTLSPVSHPCAPSNTPDDATLSSHSRTLIIAIAHQPSCRRPACPSSAADPVQPAPAASQPWSSEDAGAALRTNLITDMVIRKRGVEAAS